MKRLFATALFSIAAAHAAAQTSPAFEGGQATGLTLGEPFAAIVPADRAEVAQEAREAMHDLDSSSGQQSELARDTALDDFVSSRTRAEVRAEARARQSSAGIYDGGASS
jgi:hypothetical protein